MILDEGPLTQRAVPGPALYFVSAMPDGKADAVVGILHGYADHAARYAHVMEAWCEAGIGAVALDMRGHGRATGTRGYCTRFEEFLDDAAELSRVAAEKARGAPLFLLGHSFGGLVATMSALESPRSWRGVILSSPYFGLALEVPKPKLVAARIAARIIPKLALPTGIFGKDLTHDPVRARSYDADPLVFKNATARWFRETQKAQELVFTKAPDLKLPMLVTFGSADPIAKLEAAQEFFAHLGSSDKTWDVRDGMLHEPLMEVAWRDVAHTMSDWILQRASGPASSRG